ncbi:DUF6992 family protein [Hymenobacter properus]|uniref:Uncharacterized protein n=1 Tax=Hymenobacter properus TaxID=2791026 RepID=A0A931FIA2_9BACT|nr:hypothetical protein [Hymenobacter properus]MBF9141837.1 hypothetical protein [Hymenobacter properus]MBR7720645.1 hypothetical protein [Microvirga sp. SRT04]
MPGLDVAALDHAREMLLGRALAVLAAWALLNLLVSGILLRRADRRFVPYYFHGMNVGWGLVNTVLACWGILHLRFTSPPGLRLAELVAEQLHNENLFLLNTGLDVAYVMTGFYLRALAAVPGQANAARLDGFGRALWVQGGFLLVFDAAVWCLLHWQGQAWIPLI